MRIHTLTFSGIGPFKERQEIDFDDLSATGLFLIEGPTGAGKTTIIDALVYALFGVASSGGDDVTRMRMRSHHCAEDDPTGVSCEFSVDGRRHRVSRVPAGFRDPDEPDKPAKSKGVRQTLVEFAPDGSELRILTARKDLDAHVEQLLGMTAEQFRQLVVLPQGQFSELLRKTPAERLASLAPLLEDPAIALIQDDLERAGATAREQRRDADIAVDQAAQRLAGRLKSWLQDMSPDVTFTDPSIDDDARLAVVSDIRAALERQSESADAARDEQAEETQKARDAEVAALRVLEALQGVSEAQQAVSIALIGLGDDDRAVSQETITTTLADLQRLEGSLEGHAAWELQAAERAAERDRLLQQIERCEVEEARLTSERDAVPRRRSEIETQRGAAQKLSGALAAARAEVDRLLDRESKARQLAELRERLSTQEAAAARAEADVVTAEAEADQARLHWQQLLTAQHAGAAAALATHLHDGDPCPVCGALEHPDPARVADESLVGEADVAIALADADRARSAATAAAAAAASARAAMSELATSAAALTGAVGDVDADVLRQALVDARGLVERAEEAEAGLAELERELAALADADRELSAAATELRAERAGLAATVAAHEESERRRAAEIASIIGAAESATSLVDSIRLRITRLTALDEAWTALATATAQVPPEGRTTSLPEAQAHAEIATTRLREAAELLKQLSDRATTCAATRDEAEPLARAFVQAIGDRRAVHADTTPAIDLANLVTANNSKRLQLRSYALQRRFASVLAAASVHIDRMSAGRFQFELSEETAKSGQSGLGISLFDSWTGRPQDPKSLSGGETFYASLALALGLADVVRGEAGGSALETLFVDEGFGSLDQDTLSQVLEQLDQLRAGRRAVGVVSHVTEMRESIAERLEVRRQDDRTSVVRRARTA